ncbi:MAG: tetratricopeptide repeat protein [Spirulina sp.]
MLLSINNSDKEKYHFTWQGTFRHVGTLADCSQLLESLRLWQEAYQDFLVEPARGKIQVNLKLKPPEQELRETFTEMVSQLDRWLKSSEDFWQASYQAIQERDRDLTLCLDPQSPLALLPWESSFLGENYRISYCSPKFSRENNSKKGEGILAVLGDMGKDDRPILEKYGAEILQNPNIDALCQALRHGEQSLVYYGTHGDHESLHFGEVIATSRLRDALRESAKRGTRVLFANSCNGSGLVWLDLPLSAFIVWKVPVMDKIARDFAEFFFEALEAGNYVEAFYQASSRIADKHDSEISGISTFVQLWMRPESPVTSQQLSVGKLVGAVLGSGFGTLARWKTAIPVAIVLTVLFFLRFPVARGVGRMAVKIDKAGHVNWASRLYDLSSLLDNGHGAPFYNRASLAEDRGETEGIVENYRKSAERGYIDAFVMLSRALFERENYRQAIFDAERCIDVTNQKDINKIWKEDTLILCHTRIAWSYSRLGHTELALNPMQEALKLVGDRREKYYFDAYCAAIEIYSKTENREEVVNHAQTILDIQDEVSEEKRNKIYCFNLARAVFDGRSKSTL